MHDHDESVVELYQEYIKNLWGKKVADYFLHPCFQSSATASASRRQSTCRDNAEPILLGGYPNGMLRGARVQFRPDLKTWLTAPTDMKQFLERRESIYRRGSLANLLNQASVTTLRKPNSVNSLLESLRIRAGGNPGATKLWDLLRTKSYDMLVGLENQMSANERHTFAAFVQERALAGDQKPPLCDFVRENPSSSLIEVIKHLKAPKAEKNFRKMRAMVSWAERNRDQFKIVAYQHDLKDMLTDEQLAELMDEYFIHSHVLPPLTGPISQAEADKLADRLPSITDRSLLGPLERPKPPLKSVFAPNVINPKSPSLRRLECGETKIEDDGASKYPQSTGRSVRICDQTAESGNRDRPVASSRLAFIKKPQQRILQGKQVSAAHLPPISSKARPVTSAAEDEVAKYDLFRERPLSPLCWSQLVEQLQTVQHPQPDLLSDIQDEIPDWSVSSLGATETASSRPHPSLVYAGSSLWKPKVAVSM
ncbi:unnamed protein product [Calicophoron daubneyi]|uniref:Uncharacterized protein n=1 Tax=Calicophoron daubneyi TaxID=300641 RepID=A0AAV2U0F8_CALDB